MDEYSELKEWIDRNWDSDKKKKFNRLKNQYNNEQDETKKSKLKKKMGDMIASEYGYYTLKIANNDEENKIDNLVEDYIDDSLKKTNKNIDNVVKWIIERVNNKDLNYMYDLNKNSKLINILKHERLLIEDSSLGTITKINYPKVKHFILNYDGDLIRTGIFELVDKIDNLIYVEVKDWINSLNSEETIDAQKIMNIFKIKRYEANSILNKLKEDKLLNNDNLLIDEKIKIEPPSDKIEENMEYDNNLNSLYQNIPEEKELNFADESELNRLFPINEGEKENTSVSEDKNIDSIFDFGTIKVANEDPKEDKNMDSIFDFGTIKIENEEPPKEEPSIEENKEIDECKSIDIQDINNIISWINGDEDGKKFGKGYSLKNLNKEKFVNGGILGIPMKLYKNVLGIRAKFFNSVLAKKFKSYDLIDRINELEDEELDSLFNIICDEEYSKYYISSISDLAWRQVLQRIFNKNLEAIEQNMADIDTIYEILLDKYKELKEIEEQLNSENVDPEKRKDLIIIYNKELKDSNIALDNMSLLQRRVENMLNPNIRSKSLKYVWDNIVKSKFKTYGKNNKELIDFNTIINKHITDAKEYSDLKELELKIYKEKMNNDYYIESQDKLKNDSLNFKRETDEYLDSHEEYFKRLDEWQRKNPLYRLVNKKPNELEIAIERRL